MGHIDLSISDALTIPGLEAYPNTSRIVDDVLAVWPEHRKIAARSLGGRDKALMDHTEEIAGIVFRVASEHAGGLPDVMQAYRYMCEKIMVPEEWYFRRHNKYRLSTFLEANAEVYSQSALMNRYMLGGLASYVLWLNHIGTTQHFTQNFISKLEPNTDLLEVGPGHGLLLYLASRSPNVSTITGWDVSPESLKLTRASLDAMQIDRSIDLKERNIFSGEAPALQESSFDAIVLSEVLEHLERPGDALKTLHGLARPNGKVWINVPANSPAPDHIYLIRHPDEAAELVADAGFEVLETGAFPTAGASLERAIKLELTVNCVVVGRKAA